MSLLSELITMDEISAAETPPKHAMSSSPQEGRYLLTLFLAGNFIFDQIMCEATENIYITNDGKFGNSFFRKWYQTPYDQSVVCGY